MTHTITPFYALFRKTISDEKTTGFEILPHVKTSFNREDLRTPLDFEAYNGKKTDYYAVFKISGKGDAQLSSDILQGGVDLGSVPQQELHEWPQWEWPDNV